MASTTTPPFTRSNPTIPRNTPGSIAPAPIATSGTTTTSKGVFAFSVQCSTHIAAPLGNCVVTLLKYAEWPEWNRFVPKCTILSETKAPEPACGKDEAQELPTWARGPGILKVGDEMRFEVHMNPDDAKTSRTQDLRLTAIEGMDDGEGHQGLSITWASAMLAGYALKAERTQELVDDGQGGTEYTCWETFSGPLAPVVRHVVGSQLEKAFQAWMDDLKKRSESEESRILMDIGRKYGDRI